MMSKKEFNEKIADSIADILGNIVHRNSWKYVDPNLITNDLCRRFQATKWEQQYFISRMVNEFVTARPAMWHIESRKMSRSKPRELTDEEKEKWK